jgi:FkbM family methyltransferase
MMTARPEVWIGEGLRWYLKSARHPFKDYVAGHYWPWFARRRVWISYDESAVLQVCLGDYMQRKIFFDGYYEPGVIEWLKRTLTADDALWDIGANIGAIALVAARRCRRVVAFEPDPRSISRLTEHVEVNRVRNLTIVPAALGERSGTVALYQSAPTNSGMSSIIEEWTSTGTSVQVPTYKADEFLASQPDAQPTVIKLDVEGAEHLVLRGASELLRTRRVRAMVFEDRRGGDGGPSNEEVLACLGGAGYRVRPLGASDPASNDGLCNFVATLSDATA